MGSSVWIPVAVLRSSASFSGETSIFIWWSLKEQMVNPSYYFITYDYYFTVFQDVKNGFKIAQYEHSLTLSCIVPNIIWIWGMLFQGPFHHPFSTLQDSQPIMLPLQSCRSSKCSVFALNSLLCIYLCYLLKLSLLSEALISENSLCSLFNSRLW